jgi:hypothetical protein
MLQTNAAAATASYSYSSQFKLCAQTKATIVFHFGTAITVQDGDLQ